MIKIENPESELFEYAYFILRQNAQVTKKCKKDELMREAVRLTDGKLNENSEKTIRAERKWRIISFVVGAVVASAVFGLALLLK